MSNIIETVQYYEDLTRLSKIKGDINLESVAIAKRINNYVQNDDRINNHLLKDLQLYSESLEQENELVICIKDLVYSVASYDQCRIDIKIKEGDCFKVTGFAQDDIIFKTFNNKLTIRMKKKTFKYYFGVINSKGKSIKEFFNSKIFREMDDEKEEN